jgi:hypothetical protein
MICECCLSEIDKGKARTVLLPGALSPFPHIVCSVCLENLSRLVRLPDAYLISDFCIPVVTPSAVYDALDSCAIALEHGTRVERADAVRTLKQARTTFGRSRRL